MVILVEYSFKRDDLDRPIAELSMEAEAFGHWLSIEMSERNVNQIAQVIEAVSQLLEGSRWQYELQGREFSLQLSRDQALVKANAVAQSEAGFSSGSVFAHDELDDDGLDSMDDLYDEDDELADASAGLIASSGLEDFKQLMSAWSEYVRS